MEMMTPEHEELLHRKLRRDIILNLDLKEELFMSKMEEDGYSMSESMKENVQLAIRQMTTKDANGYFIDELRRRPDRAFWQFIAALKESGQDDLANLIKSKITNQVERDQVDNARETENIVTLLGNTKKNLTKVSLVKTKPEERARILQSDDSYLPMISEKQRGRILLINNSIGMGVGNDHLARPGSKKDVEYIKNLAEKLGYEIVPKEDLEKNQMEKFLTKQAERSDLKDIDVLVIGLMAHGNCNNLRSIRNEEVSITGTILPTFSDEKCPLMKNKPKLFFIQACQSNKKGKSEHIEISSNVSDTILDLQLLKVLFSSVLRSRTLLVPMAMHIFSYEASRDPEEGTWFIRAVVAAITLHSHRCDIATIHELVHDTVYQLGIKANDIQVSRRLENLRKRFYFITQ